MNTSAAITSAWPTWLAATGGGADVIIDGRAAVKGVAVDVEAGIAFGRSVDAPEDGSLRLLASEAGTVTATSTISVDGVRVYLTSTPHRDPSKTLLIMDYSQTQPLSTELM